MELDKETICDKVRDLKDEVCLTFVDEEERLALTAQRLWRAYKVRRREKVRKRHKIRAIATI